MLKKHFNKELVMNKEENKDFKNSLNVRFVTMIILIMILKCEIIVISLENIEALHIEIVILILS